MLTIRRVNPIYYVTFTTATLTASFILFKGFNTADAVNTISLLCGFLVIFSGVYLLNLSREDPDGAHLLGSADSGIHLGGFEDAPPVDGIGIIGTRRSMQARRSTEHLAGARSPRHHHSISHNRRVSAGSVGSSTYGGDREGLMRGHERGYDLEGGITHSPHQLSGRNSFGLGELAEDSDEEANGKKGSYDDEVDGHGRGNGHASNGTPLGRLSGSGQQRIKRETVRMGGASGKGGGGRDA